MVLPGMAYFLLLKSGDFLLSEAYHYKLLAGVARKNDKEDDTMKKRISDRKRKVWLCAMIASAVIWQVPGLSQAAEVDEYELDQLVVTATKTPVKQFEANANVSVITRDNIERNHYPDLPSALRNVPGVTINTYGAGVGYEYSNMIRINGSDKIVILVDGVRITSLGVGFPGQLFSSMDNVERIEVLKGSASTLYGSDAQGGVINIITRKAAENKTNLTIKSGSYSNETYSIMNSGKSDEYSWVVTLQKDNIGNYKDAHSQEVRQHANKDHATFKLTKQLDAASDLTFNYEQYKADKFYKNTNLYPDLYGDRFGQDDNYSWRIIYNYNPSSDLQNKLVVFNNVYDYGSKNTDGPWGPSNNSIYVKTTGFQEQFTKQLDSQHLLTTGFDFTQDKISAMYSVKGKTLTNRSLFLQDQWNINSVLNLTTGIRYDSPSNFESGTSLKANLGYKQDENTNYYISYNEFFVTPTPSQLYGTYGNKDLKPNDGNTIEAGISHKFDPTLTGTFHIFKRTSDNKTYFGATNTYQNATEHARGWDVQLSKELSKQFNAFVGYTYANIDPTGTGEPNVDGYIPKGVWNVGMNYQQDRYAAQLQGRGIVDKVGQQRDAFPNSAFFPETTYWVWDLAVNYQAAKDINLFIKVNNLFDKYYAEYSNASTRAYWDGHPGEWWPNAGRNFQVGVQYSF
ncbi:colicin I receptor [Sporomusaceae bacterium FL31]|nr:colicin I receptor [Sporomusaceae bacterium FL31]GCE34039.1 colicin I receptor [Sporomusaceae bacterium]